VPLRWKATGASGRWFPCLDADRILEPADETGSTLSLSPVTGRPLARWALEWTGCCCPRWPPRPLGRYCTEIAAKLTSGAS
jgi:hypothetical protein